MFEFCFPCLKWSDFKCYWKGAISLTYNKLPFSSRLPRPTLFLISSLLTCTPTPAFCLSLHSAFITFRNLVPFVPRPSCLNVSLYMTPVGGIFYSWESTLFFSPWIINSWILSRSSRLMITPTMLHLALLTRYFRLQVLTAASIKIYCRLLSCCAA